MGIQDKYLFPTLEAGSSRVFNICARTSQLTRSIEDGGEETKPEYLFNTRELNRVILVKEARTDRKNSRYHFANSVGTKLYLPYNPERIYEGGKSAFLDDPQIDRILQDHFGLDINNRNKNIDDDLRLIKLLDDIPSLDPFLVKDKLNIEGISANEIYFEISETEWKAIQAHIAEKLKPVINFAFQDSEELQRGRTIALINKLWNTKDIDALRPIITAFNLPEQEAKGIFSAWKGIMYYDYEYNRCQPGWNDYAEWIRKGAKPIDFVERERKDLLQGLIENVSGEFESARQELKDVFSTYGESYSALFVRREDPAPFIRFMRDAVRLYWILGTKMSAINHSVSVWDTLTSGSFKRRLKYEQLFNLFDLQRDIFEKS